MYTLILSSTGCATIKFQGHERIPVVLDSKENHTKDISVRITKEYFLWGIIPNTHQIYVDDAFSAKGYESVAELSIETDHTKENLFWTFLTFGFYVPVDYVLKGKTYLR